MKILEVTDMSSDDIAELINRNCRPWLDAVGNNMAFRGVKSDEEFLKIPQPHARAPKSMDYEINQMLVRAFAELGFKANRDNSFFVYGNRWSGYGRNSYGFFPVGKFDYTWSPKIEDLFVDIPNDVELMRQMDGDQYLIITAYDKNDAGTLTLDEVAEIIQKTNPKFNIIAKKLISRDGQYYFKLDSAHVDVSSRSVRQEEFRQIIQQLDQTTHKLHPEHDEPFIVFDVNLGKDGDKSNIGFMKDLIKEMGYKNTDIVAALNARKSGSPVEIAIACESAYLVREDMIPWEDIGFLYTEPQWFKPQRDND